MESHGIIDIGESGRSFGVLSFSITKDECRGNHHEKSIILCQFPLQIFHGIIELIIDGLACDTQPDGDFRNGQLILIMEYKNLAPLPGKGIDPGKEDLGQIIPDDVVIRLDGRNHHRFKEIEKMHITIRPVYLPKYLIPDRAIEIRPQIPDIRLLATLPDTDKNILNDI